MDLPYAYGSNDFAFQLRTCEISEILNLIKKIGNANVRGVYGDTALHDLNDSPERCKILIENGANLNNRDRSGRTPLHLVRNPEVCKVLLENGADVNARDFDGQTPLHHLRNVQVCQMLIEYGADINATAAYGWTPLMNVAYREDSDSFKNYYHLLLYYNADATITDNENRNVLFQSIRRLYSDGHVDLIEILFNFSYDEIHEPIHWKLISEFASIPELSHIFEKLVEICSKIDYCYDDLIEEQRTFLEKVFQFNPYCLRIFLDKFKNSVKRTLKYVRNCSDSSDYRVLTFSDDLTKSEQILNILDEYELLEEFIKTFDVAWRNLIEEMAEIQLITKMVLIFLSYGLNLQDRILDKIFNKFGYCELFRILLHCDLKRTNQFFWDSSMAQFIYNINLSVNDLIRTLPSISHAESSIVQILEQFAHPDIVEYYDYLARCQGSKDILAKINTLPKIPKLVELARNTVREHIVKKFNFVNSRQFYTYIQNLEISQVYKDILGFRRKLYV